MMKQNEEQLVAKKPYVTPQITRIKLDDKQVVAMAVCKDSLDNPSCGQDGITPLFNIDLS